MKDIIVSVVLGLLLGGFIGFVIGTTCVNNGIEPHAAQDGHSVQVENGVKYHTYLPAEDHTKGE